MPTFRPGLSSRLISNNRWCVNSILTSKHEAIEHPGCWTAGCLWLTANAAIAHIHVPASQGFLVTWVKEIQIHVPPHLHHLSHCCPCPVSSVVLMNGRCTRCTDCRPQGDNADKVSGCRSYCKSLPGEENANMKVFKLYVGCRKGFDQWADCSLPCSKYSLPIDA